MQNKSFNIFIPTKGPNDWKGFLAEPDRQWKTGYSAKTLAHCWEVAEGFPVEIKEIFKSSGLDEFRNIEAILAVPEYEVPLPGGSRPSQNDIFVLAKAESNLASIMVEGKVSEPFGQILEDWMQDASKGKQERLAYIVDQLGLKTIPNNIRYQLLHRTASAIIEAKRFNAKYAIMLVHSFSQENEWFDDYQAFINLYGVNTSLNKLFFLTQTQGVSVYSAWVKGNMKYLKF